MRRIWKRNNDKEVFIDEMSDGHISNAIRKIRRENRNNYKELEEYMWLNEELNNRKQETISKFNNKSLDEQYNRMCKNLNSIDRDTIYKDMEYEIQKARINGFVEACEIFLRGGNDEI